MATAAVADMKKPILSLALFLTATLFFGVYARADEGMWMIHMIDSALEKEMKARGLQLSGREIYDAEASGSVSDAIVSLGFYCSAGIISDEGLLITNHHCAYADIHALSTPGHNYLENGFWALRRDREIPVPGKEVFFLRKVLDVTDEVEALADSLRGRGEAAGSRRLSYLMEKKYAAATGLEAYLSPMWSGEKQYMALYRKYTDLRLVAAPPVSLAAFGGDEDNWEWPQHKADFALYRIYTAPDGSPADYAPGNVPLRPARKLTVSRQGVQEGDFTMVIGYPGRTNRYASAAEIRSLEEVRIPLANDIRKRQMDILRGWMDRDPAIRLKYADTFFNLSNLQEMQEGEALCFRRFGVVQERQVSEARLQAWIDADPERKARWGTLIPDMGQEFAAMERTGRARILYRETLFRGTGIYRILLRMKNTRGGLEQQKEFLARGLTGTDPRVERDLVRLAVERYCSGIAPSLLGPYQKDALARCNGNATALADSLWNNCFLRSPEAAAAYTGKEMLEADPLWRFFNDAGINDLDHDGFRERRTRVLALQKEYRHAWYRMNRENSVSQYPDANSTMRLSYGTVSGLQPRDAVSVDWKTTSAGLLEKHDPTRHDFTLDARMLGLLREDGITDGNDIMASGRIGSALDRQDVILDRQDVILDRQDVILDRQDSDSDKNLSERPRKKKDPGNDDILKVNQPEHLCKNGKTNGRRQGNGIGTIPINFLTDNDITGGNSGSPVLNAQGELIGLAFDGNKESLASDCAYTPGYNRCVCVDIRYVLWILDRYAGMQYLLEEIFPDS